MPRAGQTNVRTLDTNVVVRLLIGDDPRQTPIAERAFLKAIATGGVDLPDVVLIDALEQFRQGGDLADQLILARAARIGALPMLSFDLRFSSCEGVELLVAEATP